MSNGTEKRSCASTCWIIAAIIGIVLAIVLLTIGDWRFIPAVFAGIVAGIVLGFLLPRFICSDQGEQAGTEQAASLGAGGVAATAAVKGSSDARGSGDAATDAGRSGDVSHGSDDGASDDSADNDAAGDSAADESVEGSASGGKAETSAAGDSDTLAESSDNAAAVVSDAATITVPTAFKMQPSKALAGEAELASRKGAWTYVSDGPTEAGAGTATANKTAAKSTSEMTTSSDAVAEPTDTGSAAQGAPASDNADAAEVEGDEAATAAENRAPVAADGQPEVLKEARAGGADDLKLISGVGPKLEATLNDLGFWHFDQIAGWRKEEIEWVDQRLRFKGRIERDDWMSQAKILAKGGETEFSKRSNKKK